MVNLMAMSSKALTTKVRLLKKKKLKSAKNGKTSMHSSPVSIAATQQRLATRRRKSEKLREKKVSSHLLKPEPSQKIVCKKAPLGVPIAQQTMECLQPGEWLNDEVINNFLRLVQNESKGTLWCVSTYFWPKLSTEGYDGVSRWATRSSVDIRKLSAILVPFNVDDEHWSLAEVNLERRKIRYMCSLGRPPPMGLRRKFVEYLSKEWPCLMTPQRRRQSQLAYPSSSSSASGTSSSSTAATTSQRPLKKKLQAAAKLPTGTAASQVPPDDWLLFKVKTPLQTNDADCGIHTIMYAMKALRARRKDTSYQLDQCSSATARALVYSSIKVGKIL